MSPNPDQGRPVRLIRRHLAACSIALAPLPLAAQTADAGLIEIRDWLEQNVVPLSTLPVKGAWSELMAFTVDECSALKLTVAVRGPDGSRSRTLRMTAPIRWSRLSIRASTGVPSTVAPPPSPGSTDLRIDYEGRQVTIEDPQFGPRPPSATVVLTMRTWENAELVKEKLTRLAQLCAASQ